MPAVENSLIPMNSNFSKHEHHHAHGDDHHHSHAPQVSPDNERQIFLAMLLTGGFMVVEVVGGIVRFPGTDRRCGAYGY